MREPRCKVCRHKNLDQIETLLLSGSPKRTIAASFGVSRQSLLRHLEKHVPAKLIRAARAREYSQADNLLEKLAYLETRAIEFLDIAKSRRAPAGAAALIRELRELAELAASVTGEVERIRIQADFTAHPAWLRIQATILRAARNNPELLSELRGEFARIVDNSGNGGAAAIREPATRP